NDIYRRTLAPRWGEGKDDAHVDRVALIISRVATVLVLIGAVALAWNTREKNVALLVWIGVGGMMAASAAPMFLGVLWRRATRAGSITGFIVGGIAFSVLHSASLPVDLFAGTGALDIAVQWLDSQSNNPFACATLGAFFSIAAMVVVSYMTTPPSEEHLRRVFGE
ncbi:MAG: sodium:solute symporter family transporter, partial [Gammaproteobacteria bacterium]